MNGRDARSPSLVAIRCHRGLLAEDIVGVTNGIGSSTFVGLVPAKVVFVDNSVAERIGDGGEIAELIVGVSRAVAERIDGGRMLTKGVVFSATSVAAAIGLRDLATKGVVGKSVGYGGDRDGLQLDTVTRDRQRPVGSVWDGLAGNDESRIDKRLIFSHVSSNVERARTRGQRSGEAGELSRGRRNEWRDGGVGAGDDVGLGEPDDGVVENKGREGFRFAPFRRASRDARPYQTGCRDAVTKCVVGVLDNRLVVGRGGNNAAEGVVGVGGRKNRALEAGSLFADGLAEEIFVALGEARRICGFALYCARPASAIGGDAVGVELWGYGGASNGERVTRGRAGSDTS